jgi:hypothetical protein
LTRRGGWASSSRSCNDRGKMRFYSTSRS